MREKQRLKIASIKNSVKVGDGKRKGPLQGKRDDRQKDKKPTKRTRDARKAQEGDEMEKDYRLLKKLKKGDISEEEFSRAVAGDEFSNDNNDASRTVLKKRKKGRIGK